mmetsp:Transcript_18509/g.38198  ORF Transcript_18509/g.38198 Transcript_18509/m.38198 type:complete len:384 (+) Transcript_18509:248-1399(+)|eukprot:CAMPEP_0201275724 /NCGR_PEP_ID=MMETSP0853-20130426/53599_1 /ASSEMBLY_ACC=CAM_ASM_000640 /TAXON_ID=183588 /ORGANISM="Pseudo-nitzschia fraudulenta, Strain WWA7" /LENGTH=383 /DNA_ID=CAMNT_0047583449 /DNA_START=102 /DNA_END=1253 /DNA_ORIENTATION=-
MPPQKAASVASPLQVANGLSVLIKHAKKDLAKKKQPPRLSHYRVIPSRVQTAYDLLQSGAQLVRATATKYALIGAIDTKDQGSLGSDLLKGCELIGAAAHVTIQDASGCSRSVREYNQKAALNVYIATLRLVEAFHPELKATGTNKSSNAATTVAVATKGNTVGAQKTGAVWEACDHIVNKMLPQGNRNAIRREIFTWTRECNDTMEEFEEMIELGPRDEDEESTPDNNDDDDYDDFGFGGGDDQYSERELAVARPCLGLLKNSRGNMKIALETCEALGEKVTAADGDSERDELLDAILTVHEYAKKVGEGVTDLGSLMYPPLLPPSQNLKDGIRKQAAYIQGFQDYVLGLPNMPTRISNLANTLKNAAETKEKDFSKTLVEN